MPPIRRKSSKFESSDSHDTAMFGAQGASANARGGASKQGSQFLITPSLTFDQNIGEGSLIWHMRADDESFHLPYRRSIFNYPSVAICAANLC